MNAIATLEHSELMERVLTVGDLAQLTPGERNQYYGAVCRSVGLNPLTRPFEYLRLNGKLVLYARRDAGDQLRKIHGVSLRIVSQENDGDVYTVTTEAKAADGRLDMDIGAVVIASLRGEALANARMKAVTKSKRRVTLSICGLGLLDETEVSDVPPEQRQDWDETHDHDTGEVIPQKPAKQIRQSIKVLDEFGGVFSTCVDLREAVTSYKAAKLAASDKAAVARNNLGVLRKMLEVAKNGNRQRLQAEIEAAEATSESVAEEAEIEFGDGVEAQPLPAAAQDAVNALRAG
jgi:hypothetical protein